jgi:hypothetical protein
MGLSLYPFRRTDPTELAGDHIGLYENNDNDWSSAELKRILRLHLATLFWHSNPFLAAPDENRD